MPSLSREQFIEEVLRVVSDRFPLVKMGRAEQPFSMRVNGNVATLENLYRAAMLSPKEMRHQIERWIVELLRAAEGAPDREGTFEELKDKILPILVPEHTSKGNDRTTITQPLIPGLMVGYAIDGDRTIAHIPEMHFKQWGVTVDELHETAIENLIARSEQMAAHAAQDDEGEVNLIIFQQMDGYDAARVLLPTLHDRLKEYLGSPFVAAVPNRDILLCFRDDEETVEHLRTQIKTDYRKLPHGISDKLVLITPDGLASRV